MKSILQIKNLSFSYFSKSVLEDIDLDVEEHDIFVLLGPNGAGKTTFMKCILGLLKHEKGSVKYFDKELNKYSKTELAKIVCFVPQLSTINNGFLARDYIAFACTPNLKFYESPGLEVYKKIDKLAVEFGAVNLLNRPMCELSGGEQQIISIVKALAQDCPMIVLDEPTSALDYGNQGKFLEYIKKLKMLGKTIIISSHNPNHALILDSKICVLQNKKIEYLGKASEIISEEMLSRVYGGTYSLIRDESGKFYCTWKPA